MGVGIIIRVRLVRSTAQGAGSRSALTGNLTYNPSGSMTVVRRGSCVGGGGEFAESG